MAEETITAAFRGSVGRFTLDATFAPPAYGITALFGPSGSGKALVLRCIAGLQRLPSGQCIVGRDIWQNDSVFLAPHEPPIGYVFQEASLFPHLSVKRNLLYGTKGKAATGAVAFEELVDLLGLERLLDRSPQNLSGGERQRIAIGGAVLSQPKLLLMDEPLSALDRTAKGELLPFFERLRERLSLPVIYVSHDLGEVQRLADYLVLLKMGRVLAAGPLRELQSDPTLPLMSAGGAAVSVNAVVDGYDAAYGLIRLSVDGGKYLVPGSPSDRGTKRRLRIFAGVSLARELPSTSTIINVLPATILAWRVSEMQQVTAVLGLGPEGK
jgi:molybdate transport system ATP-binding protein